MLGQRRRRWRNIGSMSRICWVVHPHTSWRCFSDASVWLLLLALLRQMLVQRRFRVCTHGPSIEPNHVRQTHLTRCTSVLRSNLLCSFRSWIYFLRSPADSHHLIWWTTRWVVLIASNLKIQHRLIIAHWRWHNIKFGLGVICFNVQIANWKILCYLIY